MRPRSEPQWDCFIIVWAGYCGFVKLLNTRDDWFIRAEETWYDCKETIVLSSALPCTTITLEIGSAFTQICPMHWSTSQASAWSTSPGSQNKISFCKSNRINLDYLSFLLENWAHFRLPLLNPKFNTLDCGSVTAVYKVDSWAYLTGIVDIDWCHLPHQPWLHIILIQPQLSWSTGVFWFLDIHLMYGLYVFLIPCPCNDHI